MPGLDPLGANKEIDERYRSFVDDIITYRVRIFSIIGFFLYLSFNLLDWITYPTLAFFFFKIRLVCSTLFIIILILSFWKKAKPFSVWLASGIGISAAASISMMIFLSDGSSSHYYEGINLCFLAVAVMNSSYPKHNILFFSIMILFYELAIFNSSAVFNKANYCSANFFMISTAFLVILMTKFYSTQHRQAFLRQEQIKLSEKKLAVLYSKADELSKTDELTKIHNRRSFFDILKNKIELSETSNKPFYLVIFDVDYFKELNDRWGHSFGDLALTKIVGIVKNNIRTDDCLGRFGGDEFILCLDIPDNDMLMRRLTKISQEVTSLNLMQQNQSILISISIGATRFIAGQQMTKNQLLEKADQQLLMVKKSNRGQISISPN